MAGRTALRYHSRKKGQVTGPLCRMPKASGLTERIPMLVPEVPRRPSRRVDLFQIPSQRVCLPGQGGDEGVNGLGVLHISEQLSASSARHVAPVQLSNQWSVGTVAYNTISF